MHFVFIKLSQVRDKILKLFLTQSNVVVIIKENAESLKNLTLESILSGIHCFRCHDHTQLVAVARTLDAFLSQHDEVSRHFVVFRALTILVGCQEGHQTLLL